MVHDPTASTEDVTRVIEGFRRQRESVELHNRAAVRLALTNVTPPHRPRPLIVNRAGTRRPMGRALADPRQPSAGAAPGGESWYRVGRPTNAASGRGGTAEVYIYDEIGYWGVSAQRLIDELRELDADVIELHVNSPGGEVYDGIAIYNALLNHPATVNVTVDALAASAASFIAQAGHTVTMAKNAEMMIHDAIGVAWDNAEGLRELADRLDAVSDNIAGIYADRAGGTVAGWRKTMRAETWYSAAEAVSAGLADKVVTVERRGAGDDATENRWAGRRDAISARFRYVNRGATVAPPVDAAAVDQGWQFPAPAISLVDLPPVPAELLDDTSEPSVTLIRWADTTTAGIAHDLGVASGAVPAFALDPDVFRTAISMAYENAPAPPVPVAPAGALTRTVVSGNWADGVNLHDLMREVTG